MPSIGRISDSRLHLPAWENMVRFNRDTNKSLLKIIQQSICDYYVVLDELPSSPPSPPATLSRKNAVAKWQSRMENAYALVQMPGNVILQMHRGTPPLVTITVTKRQNRKFITRVRGVEHYGINAMQFKNDISQRLACAGSVEDSPMEKLPHKDHVELVFQGNIHEELQALLLGDCSLSSHGGVSGGDSGYCQLPKNSIQVILRKGVPGHKK